MSNSILLKTSSILWVAWGVVHLFFGVMIINGDAAFTVQAIANGIEQSAVNYPDEVTAIFNQHGWNLIWFGAVTIVAGKFIWSGNSTSMWVAAMVGGLADLGYFVFLDLGGYVLFFPGTLMTIIALSAILLNLMVYFRGKPTS